MLCGDLSNKARKTVQRQLCRRRRRRTKRWLPAVIGAVRLITRHR